MSHNSFHRSVTGEVEHLEMRRLMSPTPYPAGVGDSPHRLVATADFNADGQKDLLWQDHSTNEVYIEIVTDINNPTPTYTKHSLGFVSDPAWHAEAVADFNGDASKPDILLFNYETRLVEQWLVDAQTVILKRPFKTLPVAEGWRIEGTGNFDGDHDASDIVWRNYLTLKVCIWDVSYDTPFAFHMYDGPRDVNWAMEGADDFNGDGVPDLIWRNYANGKQAVWFLGGGFVKGFTMLERLNTTPQAWDLEGIGDFNNDGHDDLIYRNYTTGQVIAWLMQSETTKVGERVLLTR